MFDVTAIGELLIDFTECGVSECVCLNRIPAAQ